MDPRDEVLSRLIVEPGKPARLGRRDPAWTGESGPPAGRSKQEQKARAREVLGRSIKELSEAQELLWASNTYSLLVIFQAIDAAGKDGTIAHVMSGVNPQGVKVVSFKEPSREELDHDFLWRVAKALPERGRIGIFNRSHYEEVMTLRVHPDWLAAERLPPGPRGRAFWRGRFEDINAFERHLDRSGTKVVKVFLHISRSEQKRRFLARLTEPGKEWKFSAADVSERAHWDEYMRAFEDAITATSTPWAPWYVIPGDHKWAAREMVSAILVDRIQALKLGWPKVTPEMRAANDEARRLLEAEPDE